MGPVNPPGTPPEAQRCELCRAGLTSHNRCIISRDPDYIAANLCMFCVNCRETKLGRVSDDHYLAPAKKWRRIVYQAFFNSKNTDGYWKMVEELNPFKERADASEQPIQTGA